MRTSVPRSLSSAPQRRQRLAHDLQRFVDLARADVERWRDAEDVAVQTALAHQQPALLRLLEELARRRSVGRAIAGRLVDDQLDREHQALAAHVADRLRMAALQLEQSVAQALAH